MAGKKDYYEVLGVSKTATKDEIKDSYRKLAMQYHPDRNKSPGAEERFKEISEAYAVLSDDEKRRQYDTLGQVGFGQQYSPEDIFRGADFESVFRGMGFDFGFGDIFEAFFGRQGFGNRPSKGGDILFDQEISLEEAARGVEKEIQVTRTEECETCRGTGSKPGTSPKTCMNCGGTGQVKKIHSSAFGRMVQIMGCPTCRGKGTVIETPCTVCRGSGLMKKTRKISVKIPRGVEEGSHMRLKGEGEASPNGGPPGDLYVQIHITPHQYFTREGDDLIYDLHLNYPQVALGAEANVPTIEGATKVNIRAGTQPGEIIKLKGKGMPRLYGYGSGDLLIRVNVSVPQKLTPRQRDLLEQLAKEFGQETKPKPNKKLFPF